MLLINGVQQTVSFHDWKILIRVSVPFSLNVCVEMLMKRNLEGCCHDISATLNKRSFWLGFWQWPSILSKEYILFKTCLLIPPLIINQSLDIQGNDSMNSVVSTSRSWGIQSTFGEIRPLHFCLDMWLGSDDLCVFHPQKFDRLCSWRNDSHPQKEDMQMKWLIQKFWWSVCLWMVVILWVSCISFHNLPKNVISLIYIYIFIFTYYT